MTILLSVLLVCVLAFFFCIAPRMGAKPDVSPLMGVYYAHRGLHDNKGDAPENSLAAIEKAVKHGYGIEFDVQLTRDRIPVVFHDESLARMCGADGHVRDYTYEELQRFPLLSSDQRIPLLADVLTAVDGKVPLIIEIKVHEKAEDVCAYADELIARYHGPYCIESFDPRAVAWYKKRRPQVIRGQLSCRFSKPGKREPFARMLVHHLLTNAVARPDFIAYDHKHKDNPSRVLCRKCFGALSVAWTIRSQQELDAAKDDFDLFIFEQFIPKG